MKWSIKKVPSIKSSIYAKKLNISRILANVLINRGIGITAGNNLINNPELLIEDASNIVNATLVAEKIENSLNKNNHFIIHGDYDVDGLTSSYIITDFLRKLGEEVELYIPERKTGYGLKQKWCNDIINNSLNNDTNYIVITVDCGITANQEIQSLLDNNIEVIVTDHHEPKEAIPNCLCSDPWMDKLSGGHHLCGAGVIWKICSLINQNNALRPSPLLHQRHPVFAQDHRAQQDCAPTNRRLPACSRECHTVSWGETDSRSS